MEMWIVGGAYTCEGGRLNETSRRINILSHVCPYIQTQMLKKVAEVLKNC